MKIRTGFVSNSSSSSFIAVGFKVDNKKITEYFGDQQEEEDGYTSFYDWCNDNNFVYYSEEDIVGVSIASSLEEMGVEEFDISKIPTYEERLKTIKTKVGEDDSKIKIYYGSYCC